VPLSLDDTRLLAKQVVARQAGRRARRRSCDGGGSRLPQRGAKQAIGRGSPQGLPIVKTFIEADIDRNSAEQACKGRRECGFAATRHFMVLGKLGAPAAALFSTLGRTAARGIDTALTMGWLKEFYGQLMDRVKINEVSTFNGERWDPSTWPSECEGVGLEEAPRGALAHYIKIKNGAIANYQLVVPTTWNGSPRDAKTQRSLSKRPAPPSCR